MYDFSIVRIHLKKAPPCKKIGKIWEYREHFVISGQSFKGA
jgi:hypothetical protein